MCAHGVVDTTAPISFVENGCIVLFLVSTYYLIREDVLFCIRALGNTYRQDRNRQMV